MLYIRRLLWDAWNTAHIARHSVSPEEVEEVCRGDYIIREGYNERIVLVGPTQGGRMLAVILGRRNQDEYSIVTAFPASRRMRRRYQEEKGA